MEQDLNHRCVKRPHSASYTDLDVYLVQWEHYAATAATADTQEPEGQLYVDGTADRIDCRSEYLQELN